MFLRELPIFTKSLQNGHSGIEENLYNILAFFSVELVESKEEVPVGVNTINEDLLIDVQLYMLFTKTS